MHFSCTGFLIGAFIFFIPARIGAAASVRQLRPQQAAAQGPEKRRQARPPCDAGAPPQHSPAAPRRPPGGRVRARRLTGTGGRHEGQGEQPPHRRLRGTGRECCPAAAGCAAAASAAINAAHTLAGFGGAAAASPQAAARTAKGRHAADAAHPVCTRQPECAALVARLAARNGL